MKHKYIALLCIMALVLGGIGSSTLRKKNALIGGGFGDPTGSVTVGVTGGISLLDGGTILTDGTIGIGGTPPGTTGLYVAGAPVVIRYNEFYAVNVYYDGGFKFAQNAPAYGGFLQYLQAGGGRISTTTNSGNAGDSATIITVIEWTAPGVVTIPNDLIVLSDTYWTGDGSGIPYGSMYNDNTDTTVTMGTSGTAVRIPSGFTVGQVNLITFQNDRELVVTKAGRYKISWSISFNTLAGSNQDIEGHIGVDNAEVGPGSAHRFIGTATDKGNMGGNAILDLAASAVISLMMVNDTGTNNINVNHADLVITMAGGT